MQRLAKDSPKSLCPSLERCNASISDGSLIKAASINSIPKFLATSSYLGANFLD